MKFWNAYCVQQITVRMQHFGQFLKHLNLEVNGLWKSVEDLLPRTWNASGQSDRPTGVEFWTRTLNRLSHLRSLRILNADSHYERRDEEQLCLDGLLRRIQLPGLRSLHLSSWSVSPLTLTEYVPASFPGLNVLDLEHLDLRSNEDDTWQMIFAMLKDKYNEVEIGAPVGLRRRPPKGKELVYRKAKVKTQTGVQRQVQDVWNKIAGKEGEAEHEGESEDQAQAAEEEHL